ncbi:MAG: uroporphyrinogen-III synthase [Holophaga sp.]|nr:uroporphyrinogen-III synthase [Holophaga sp.]
MSFLASRPLRGKRILITRPAGQGAATAEMVKRFGGHPIELPTIVITEPPDPAQVAGMVFKLPEYDLVAFTSANAVTCFFAYIEAQGHDVGIFRQTRIGAIGSGTAAALASKGLCADIVPHMFVGEAFGQAILEDPMIQAVLSHRRPRVLILRALAAREILPEILRNAGCIVDIVPVYETRPATMARRMELISRLEGQTIDCVMLTSSSSVNGLVDLLGSRSRELLRNLLVASIGPITTSSARRHGLCVGVTSDESTVKALLSAIELHFGKEV